MTRTEFEAKVEAVRMMAGYNQFTVEGCGWLAEICRMAKVNQDLIRAAFDGVSVINRITKGTGYQGQLVTNHPWAEPLSVAAWNAHQLTGEPIPKIKGYSGPVNCQKCGKQHWAGAACDPEDWRQGTEDEYNQGFGGHGY